MTSNPIYYVYAYIDPITNVPFYIGKGKNRRMYEHLESHNLSHNSHKNNKIKKLIKNNTPPIIMKLVDGLTEEQAWEKEIELIKIHKSSLTNISPGGKIGPNIEGMIFINDGVKNKLIFPSDLQSYPNFVPGRLFYPGEKESMSTKQKENAKERIVGKVACKLSSGEFVLIDKDEYYSNKGILYFPVAKTNSPETRRRKSEAMKNIPKSMDHRRKLSIKAKQQHKIKVSCLCCCKEFDIGNYTKHIKSKS